MEQKLKTNENEEFIFKHMKIAVYDNLLVTLVLLVPTL